MSKSRLKNLERQFGNDSEVEPMSDAEYALRCQRLGLDPEWSLRESVADGFIPFTLDQTSGVWNKPMSREETKRFIEERQARKVRQRLQILQQLDQLTDEEFSRVVDLYAIGASWEETKHIIDNDLLFSA